MAELVEDVRQLVGRDADTSVADLEADALARRLLTHTHHDAAVRGELECVGQQVGENLLETQGVGLEDRQRGRTVPHHLDVGAGAQPIGERLQPGDDRGDPYRADLHRERAGVQARQGEQVGHHAQQMLGLGPHGGQIVASVGAERLVVQHLGISKDGVERRAQLVRDAGEERLLEANELLALFEAPFERGTRTRQLDAHLLEAARQRCQLVLPLPDMDRPREIAARHDLGGFGEGANGAHEAVDQRRPDGHGEGQEAQAEDEQEPLSLPDIGQGDVPWLARADLPRRLAQRRRGDHPLIARRGGGRVRLLGRLAAVASDDAAVLVDHVDEAAFARRDGVEDLGELGGGEIDDAAEHPLDGVARIPNRRGEQRVRSIEQRVCAQPAGDQLGAARIGAGDEGILSEGTPDPRPPRWFGPQHLAVAIEEQCAAGEHRRLEEQVVQGGPWWNAALTRCLTDVRQAIDHAGQVGDRGQPLPSRLEVGIELGADQAGRQLQAVLRARRLTADQRDGERSVDGAQREHVREADSDDLGPNAPPMGTPHACHAGATCRLASRA